MKQNDKKRGLTFTNVLLTLLVVGTFVVGGLMYMLYLELTQTPQMTAQRHEQQQTPKIEIMSPDNKRGDAPVFRNASQVAIQASEPQSTMIESQNALLKENTPSAAKKLAAPKANSTELNNAVVTEHNQPTSNRGRPLEPINAVPQNNAAYELKANSPVLDHEVSQKRRENNAKPLKPVSPAQPKNENNKDKNMIDALL
ncbi:MAG: hypothetical protein Q4B82_04515 [Alysiella sp.]|uniref:hypothetical protein n=1 Tax=Alysiella sp. TaxID=1872483 RepID=UPI0026DB4858|nr:hypothetical protein [Alysiella sp.]MDO4433826.1 hypothetical protein [Alysiella sp.]